MKKQLTTIVLLFTFIFVWSQNKVIGSFTQLANTQIKLLGYSGFNAYAIDSIQANKKGEFQLSFGQEDFGMGYVFSENNIGDMGNCIK